MVVVKVEGMGVVDLEEEEKEKEEKVVVAKVEEMEVVD